MRRTALLLVFLLAGALCPPGSLADIKEVVDVNGNVTHYKYVDRSGGIVFVDSLEKIPAEYRKKNKLVRVGGPKKKPAPAGSATDTPGAPALPEAPPPVFQVKPEPVPAPEEPGGGSLWVALALLAVVGGLGGFAVYRRVSANRLPPRRPAADHHGRERAAEPSAETAQHERTRAHPAPVQRPDSERTPARERPEDLLKRYLQAQDYGAAARLCESEGDLAKAAAYHLESGGGARAREIFLQLKDYRRAAELFEQGGDDLKAAELYEAAAQRDGHGARTGAGGDSALRGGRLFEKCGLPDRAVAVYLKAGLYAEAAAVFESRQDFLQAAENYLKSGNPEQAAACFEQGGDPGRGHAALSRHYYERGLVKEAADHSEKAGDLMQAATMFQEIGEFARAGDLFFRSGFYAEAAENFSLVNDSAQAAEAYERAGNYPQAARALEAAGGDRDRLAALYEKAGDCYPAGRLFVKLGQLDRALNVLQQVDPASTDYASASLLVGMIFLKRGLTALAREKFLKIIDNQPVGKANLEPYYFLALCHEHAGEAEQARSIFAKILAEDYNFRDVRRRVAPQQNS